MTDWDIGRHHAAVVLAALVGVGALYVAFGGPLPFLAPGGPALDSVPEEADAVAYANAWTFTQGSSQGVADGLLSITNESLPGYTGPASLEEAVSALESAGLDPAGLRSVTAFGAYGPDGGPSAYRGVVLKTTWSETTILSALGGSVDAYEERTYNGKTVYVDSDAEGEFRAVAVLGPDRYVLGNVSAVEDSVDATVEGGQSMDGDLRSGFRSLPRGPIRFSATTPERFPGSDIAPRSVTDTVADVDTVGGVYYPDDRDVTVELSVRARDADSAAAMEPALSDGLAYAKGRAPSDSRSLVESATVSRSGRTLTVDVSGRIDDYTDAYRAVLNASVVRALLGQRVGTPALGLVPADAGVFGYADASAVGDPATRTLATTVANGSGLGASASGTLDAVSFDVVADLTRVRSVTVFGQNVSGNETAAAGLVEADTNATAVAAVLTDTNRTYDRRTVRDRTVFVTADGGNETWIGVLDGRVAVGDPGAVRSTLAVAEGDTPAVSSAAVERFEALPDRPLKLLARSSAVGGDLGSLLTAVGGPPFVGLSYGSADGAAAIDAQLTFGDASAAAVGNTTTGTVLSLLRGSFDDEGVRSVLDATAVSRSGRVVSVRATAPPDAVGALVAQLAAGEAAVPSGLGSRAPPEAGGVP